MIELLWHHNMLNTSYVFCNTVIFHTKCSAIAERPRSRVRY